MNNFIKKIAEVEKSLSEDKGNFKLFAVFSRPDTEGRWDIVISADWIKSEREGLDYISKKLTKNLSPEEIIKIVKAIAPGFGGINLEDISAPRCFEIESRLKEELDIPVFHDDLHGTAVVTTAALINALTLTGKKAKDLKLLLSEI